MNLNIKRLSHLETSRPISQERVKKLLRLQKSVQVGDLPRINVRIRGEELCLEVFVNPGPVNQSEIKRGNHLPDTVVIINITIVNKHSFFEIGVNSAGQVSMSPAEMEATIGNLAEFTEGIIDQIKDDRSTFKRILGLLG